MTIGSLGEIFFFCFDGWNDDKKINKNAKWQRHRLFGCYSYRNEMRWKGREDWRWSLLVDGAIKWEDTAIRNTRRLVSFQFLLLFRFGLFVYCVSTVSRSLARSHASRKPSNNGALAGLGQVGRRLDSCTTQQLTVFCFDCALSYKIYFMKSQSIMNVWIESAVCLNCNGKKCGNWTCGRASRTRRNWVAAMEPLAAFITAFTTEI